MTTVAIIPARGGSKRIPRKNIRDFAGKPMIAYAVEAAHQSGLFDRVIVSTDDDEIAAISRSIGAETPFSRPALLADDYAPTVAVIAHAIDAFEADGQRIDIACCIYPCVPFIRIEDLSASLSLLLDSDADYCFPITEFPATVQRALHKDPSGRVSPLFPEYELQRTQDIEPAYFDAGQFYWGKRAAWLNNPYIHRSGIGLPIPGWRSIDIDTPDDWTRAEKLHQSLLQGQ